MDNLIKAIQSISDRAKLQNARIEKIMNDNKVATYTFIDKCNEWRRSNGLPLMPYPKM